MYSTSGVTLPGAGPARDELKSRITGVDACVNPKNRDAIWFDNLVRYMLTTNDPNPVVLDTEERRFMVVPCSRAWTGKAAFFRALRETLFCAEGGRAVAAWLRTLDAGLWPRVLPKSTAAVNMIEAQRSVEQRFIEAWDGVETGMEGLWAQYQAFCTAGGLTGAKSSRSLGMRLLGFLRDGLILRRSLHGFNLYSKPGGGGAA